MRSLPARLIVVILIISCGPAQVAPTSQPTPNINRSRIDIAYTAIASLDLHRVSSRTLLTAALDAVRLDAISTGGTADPATPVFSDISDVVLSDFTLFAQAVEKIAFKNPQLSAELISDSAIGAMVHASPDCFTAYWKTAIDDPLAAGFQSRLLSGAVGYFAWHRFTRISTYDVVAETRKALDALLAQGARAWLFDWRDNQGGAFADEIFDWFLNGEPAYRRVSRVGAPQTTTARAERRLPAAYQLPIAIVMNRRSSGGPEMIAMGFKENHRATIVGTRSTGCVGATNWIALPGGGNVQVAVEEFVGPITGTHYANVGIEPDIVSEDATALDVAMNFLQTKIRP